MRKLTITSYITTILLFFCLSNAIGQESSIKNIEELIPAIETTRDFKLYRGDLNSDTFNDILLRFQLKNEPLDKMHYHIFTGKKNDKFKSVLKKSTIELDDIDGIIFDKVLIQNGYFSLEYKGHKNTSGSYKRVIFKYSTEDNSWILHSQESKIMYTIGDSSCETITTQKDFGKVLFEDYEM